MLLMAMVMTVGAYGIENGFYIIRSANNRNYVIDNNGCYLNDGNNIQLWELNWSGAQKWLVTNLICQHVGEAESSRPVDIPYA